MRVHGRDWTQYLDMPIAGLRLHALAWDQRCCPLLCPMRHGHLAYHASLLYFLEIVIEGVK